MLSEERIGVNDSAGMAAISEVREDGVSGRGSGREKVEEGEEFEVRGIFERQVSVAGPAR